MPIPSEFAPATSRKLLLKLHQKHMHILRLRLPASSMVGTAHARLNACCNCTNWHRSKNSFQKLALTSSVPFFVDSVLGLAQLASMSRISCSVGSENDATRRPEANYTAGSSSNAMADRCMTSSIWQQSGINTSISQHFLSKDKNALGYMKVVSKQGTGSRTQMRSKCIGKYITSSTCVELGAVVYIGSIL